MSECVIDWSLEDGKFSASGEYWNSAGTDINQAGQCIDSIVEDFPESKQAKAIHNVWKTYHLNDMSAGSPKQKEAIETIIKPRLEQEIEAWKGTHQRLKMMDDVLTKKIKASLWNQRQDAKELLNDLYVLVTRMDLSKIKSYPIQFHINEIGIKQGSGHISTGSKSFTVRRGYVKLIRFCFDSKPKIKTYSKPSGLGDGERVTFQIDKGELIDKLGSCPCLDYDYVCSRLRNLGLLYDASYKVETPGFKVTKDKVYIPQSEQQFVRPEHLLEDNEGKYINKEHVELYPTKKSV